MALLRYCVIIVLLVGVESIEYVESVRVDASNESNQIESNHNSNSRKRKENITSFHQETIHAYNKIIVTIN